MENGGIKKSMELKNYTTWEHYLAHRDECYYNQKAGLIKRGCYAHCEYWENKEPEVLPIAKLVTWLSIHYDTFTSAQINELECIIQELTE